VPSYRWGGDAGGGYTTSCIDRDYEQGIAVGKLDMRSHIKVLGNSGLGRSSAYLESGGDLPRTIIRLPNTVKK
jgi:hypothetical protein